MTQQRQRILEQPWVLRSEASDRGTVPYQYGAISYRFCPFSVTKKYRAPPDKSRNRCRQDDPDW